MNRQQRRAEKRGQTSSHPSPANAAATIPGAVAELFGTGLKHHQAGRLTEAEACYRNVLAAEPDYANALHLLGVVAKATGRLDLALELIGRAIKLNGRDPLYFFNFGNALQANGKFADAIAAYRQAIVLKPDYAEAFSNCGNALQTQDKIDEAIAAHRRAIHLKPNYAVAHSNLGNVLIQYGKLDEAIAACRHAIDLQPDHAEAYFNLGNALTRQGRFDEAIVIYRQALCVRPNYAEAHTNLGNALTEKGELGEAVAAYEKAIGFKADLPEAYCNLGAALANQGKLDEAVAACRRAIDIKPDYATAHTNLGNALQDQGRLDEAIAAYRQAIRLKPDYAEAYSNLLFCLNRHDGVAVEHLFDEHREWNARFGRQVPRPVAHANDRETGRRLKIGYVSPDFRQHSVAYFLEPLLQAHDRQKVEIVCYADVARPDAVTSRLRQLADHWRPTVGMSDDELATTIRADGIDILVDLAGHTAKNRLRVFARRPAPVQVTWLGYPNTTGLEAIDYRMVDAMTDPVGEADAYASETLVRLEGGFLCYGGPKDAPEPDFVPGSKNDTVTFGSFNNVSKVSAATFDAWAALLARLPQARLLLKGKQFADKSTRALFLARLHDRGVAADRVELVAWLPDVSAHLEIYDRVDIALDPFPYNGTTTTCEALWMGVPVVTLRGDRHAARVGASLLHQIGLTDLMADSVEDYIEIAASLADDRDRLTQLRHSLRPRLAASSLCDQHSFARKIEAAFRQMWQQWCEPAAASDLGQNANSLKPKRDSLQITLRDGLAIAVPATLSAVTSYVLLEQEEWFEKEVHFLRCFLRPGMNAIDIGANLGIYSLLMARLAGPDGRIFAYEPGWQARDLLENSRNLNGLDNLVIMGSAVSDCERDGRLAYAASTELRALATHGAGERVQITSLDAESAAHRWPKIDFIKIDAEGEEERIVAGGRAFLAEHSPLVMFEIKATDKVNQHLLTLLPDIGYRLFRLLSGAPILVPLETSLSLDRYELNLFAATPDRAGNLSKQRLLVETISAWQPSDGDRENALGFWRRQAFAAPATVTRKSGIAENPDYQDGLVAYAAWRRLDRPIETRCAALAFAFRTLRSLCARECTVERLSTWARVASEWGARSESVAALQQLLSMLQKTRFPLDEPFWPACSRFDAIAPGSQVADWFAAAAAEQYERTVRFSSAFGDASPVLPWLCVQRHSSAEMERRRVLIAARAGNRPIVPERLCRDAPDHRNADIWRAGLVPGTRLAED